MTVDIDSKKFVHLFHQGLKKIVTVMWDHDTHSLRLIKIDNDIKVDKNSIDISKINTLRLNPSLRSQNIFIKFSIDSTKGKLLIDDIIYPEIVKYKIKIIDKQE